MAGFFDQLRSTSIRRCRRLDLGKLDARLEDKFANLKEEITRHLQYEAIHNPIGEAVTNAMILIVMLGWSFLGVRRELFSRTQMAYRDLPSANSCLEADR
jgi:hypothetical protein